MQTNKQTNKQTNRFNGLTRLLACLLAVLMLSQAAVISPAAFADGDGSAVLKATAAKLETKLELKEHEDVFTFTYNADGNYVKEMLINEFVDFENSVVPENWTVENFNVKVGTSTLSKSKSANVGENFDVAIYVKSNQQCKKSNTINAKVTITKADATIKVNSESIYVGEKPSENFVVTTNTSGATAIEYITVYAALTSGRDNETGATKGVTTSIYIEPSAAFDKSMTMSYIKAGLILGISMHPEYGLKYYTDFATKGITVAQLKVIAPDLAEFLGNIDSLSIDISQYTDIIANIPEIADDTIIYIGTAPTHVGVYTAVAYVLDPNHNSDLGLGMLTVKMRVTGTSIDLTTVLDRKVISAEQAAEIAVGGNSAVAVLSCDGETVDQSNLRFVYSGITNKLKLYTSTSEFPTAPGRYTVTVMTVGGDYLAAPVTCSFRITK